MARSVKDLVSRQKAIKSVTVGLPEPVVVVDMPLADTEYSITLPSGAFNYMFKLREATDGTSPSFVMSLEANGTSDDTKYVNIPGSTPLVDDMTLLNGDTTFYFSCSTAGQKLECLYNLIDE